MHGAAPWRVAALALLAMVILAGVLKTRASAEARPDAAAPPAQPMAAEAPGEANLAADARLEVPVSVKAKSQALEEVLASPWPGGIRLAVSPALAKRRVTCLATRVCLRDLMAGLAATTRLSWRGGKGPATSEGARAAPGYDYELYQTEAARKREAAETAASQRRAAQSDAAKRDATIAAIQQAVQNPETAGPLAELLAGLSPEQLQLAGDLATLPEGIISANDNRHLHNRVIPLAPFAALPAGLQERLRKRIDALDPNRVVTPNENAAGLAGSGIGLVVQGGSIYLGVIDPDGRDVWISPTDQVVRKGLPGVDTDNDLPPEVNDAFRKGPPVYFYEVSERFKKRLRFSLELKRWELPDLLESLEKQTGIPFVADDYLRSRKTTYSWLLTDQDEYSLQEALRQISGAFGHSVTYRNGVMRVRTVTPGLDARSEPPAELIEHLRKLHAEKRPLQLSDYLSVAQLSDMQLETLMIKGADMVPLAMPLHVAYQMRDALRFYGSLSEEQKRRAETAAGLPPEEMDLPQRQRLWKLTQVGLGAAGQPGGRPDQEGLSVAREAPENKSATYTFKFSLSAPGAPARAAVFRLALP
jgi:hypothetical protein